MQLRYQTVQETGKVYTLFSGPNVQSTSPAFVRALYFFEGAEFPGEKLPGENGAGLPFTPVNLLLTGL